MSSPPRLTAQILGPPFGEAIATLRSLAYRNQYGSKVDDRALRWNPNLHHTLNLGVLVNSAQSPPALVSTYRLDIIDQRQDLHRALQTSQSPADSSNLYARIESLPLPVIVGCRASTHPDFQDQALHFTLRYWALRILRSNGIAALASTFESTNPWVPQLQKLGYELHLNTSNWSEFLVNQSRPHVGILNLDRNGEFAETSLRDHLLRESEARPDLSALIQQISQFDAQTSNDPVLTSWQSRINRRRGA